MPDEFTTTGIAAGIYAIGRFIEAGFKKLANLFTKKMDQERRDRDDDRVIAQFAEIQRELKLQNEAHNKSGETLVRVETRQEDIQRRITELEAELKRVTKKITGKVE